MTTVFFFVSGIIYISARLQLGIRSTGRPHKLRDRWIIEQKGDQEIYENIEIVHIILISCDGYLRENEGRKMQSRVSHAST